MNLKFFREGLKRAVLQVQSLVQCFKKNNTKTKYKVDYQIASEISDYFINHYNRHTKPTNIKFLDLDLEGDTEVWKTNPICIYKHREGKCKRLRTK